MIIVDELCETEILIIFVKLKCVYYAHLASVKVIKIKLVKRQSVFLFYFFVYIIIIIIINIIINVKVETMN